MNWGVANEVPQEVIAPTASIREREKRNDPIPSRPAWLCITSPEYAVAPSVSRGYSDDLTVEELDAIEAEQAAREAAREAKAERRRLEADAARKLKKDMDAMEKRLREERAKANKAAGFKRKKAIDPIYVPKGRAHKKDWA